MTGELPSTRRSTGAIYIEGSNLPKPARSVDGEDLTPEYRREMKQAAEIWTSQDPRPSFELVKSLDSPYPKARTYARTLLKKMWRFPSELRKMAKQADSEGHPNKKKFADHLRSVIDEMPEDRPETVAEWRAWWKHIADGDWRVFEEYERRVNPHPKYGRGTGPVGGYRFTGPLQPGEGYTTNQSEERTGESTR